MRAARWLMGLLLGLVLGVVIVIALSLIGLAAIGHALRVEDPLGRADVIVAVSGDSGPRVQTAVRLWNERHAPLIIFSGASHDPESVPSAELMKRDAVRLGVRADAVLVEGASSTTEENAARVAELMATRELRSAILVTSPYHQRRAAVLFEREFAKRGLSLRNHPARDSSWDPTFWWTSESSRTLTLVELAKLGIVVAGPAGESPAPASATPATRTASPSPTRAPSPPAPTR